VKLSACIIAKNEERNLPRLLKSLKGKFDEIVLVDTGSTDRTVEVAKGFGCRVFRHKWSGFADARNRAVKEATGDWLWHFDADFELEEEEFKKALVALRGAPAEIEAFSIGVRNFGLDGKVKAVSSHIFIHRRGIEWEGKVHESPKTRKVVGIPVFVNHYGYADPELLLKKAERNLELLKEELSYLPKGSQKYNFKLFFLVQTYSLLSTKDRSFLTLALKYAEEFLEGARDKPEEYGFFLVFMYNYYCRILWELGDYKRVKEAISEFRKLGFELPELSFLNYRVLRIEGRESEALDSLIETAVLLDKLNENPFSLKWGGASECLPLFEEDLLFGSPPRVSPQKIKEVEKLWKRRGGRNLGLVLFWLTKSERILKKLVFKYPEDLILHTLLFSFLVKSGREKDVKRLSRVNWPFSKLYRAQLLEWEGKSEEALLLLLSFLQENPNRYLLSYLYDRFPSLSKIFKLSDDNGK